MYMYVYIFTHMCVCVFVKISRRQEDEECRVEKRALALNTGEKQHLLCI